MPNWCENTLDIHVRKDVWENTLEKLLFVDYDEDNKKSALGWHRRFSFTALKPLPSPLQGTTAPARIVSQEKYDEWLKKEKTDEWEKHYHPITEEMSADYKSKYGFNNWYDWQVHNWGTKWDANVYHVNVDKHEDTDTEMYDVQICFETAWSPPYDWFHSLHESMKYLGVYAELRFSEEGCDFAGTYHSEGEEFYETEGYIYQVDEISGEVVTYDSKLNIYRNRKGQFVSCDCVYSEPSYDGEPV